MRNVSILLCVLFLGVFAYCEDKKGDLSVCDQYTVFVDSVMVGECADRVDCLLCSCWSTGQTVDGTDCGEQIVCVDTIAADCIANETLCASGIIDMIQESCDGTEL